MLIEICSGIEAVLPQIQQYFIIGFYVWMVVVFFSGLTGTKPGKTEFLEGLLWPVTFVHVLGQVAHHIIKFIQSRL